MRAEQESTPTPSRTSLCASVKTRGVARARVNSEIPLERYRLVFYNIKKKHLPF